MQFDLMLSTLLLHLEDFAIYYDIYKLAVFAELVLIMKATCTSERIQTCNYDTKM